jgi:hypothetical protein
MDDTLKPHSIRCCHFKVDDVDEVISKLSVRNVEDNVTASLH